MLEVNPGGSTSASLMLSAPTSRQSSVSSDSSRRRINARRPKQPRLEPMAWSTWLHSYQRGLWVEDADSAEGEGEDPATASHEHAAQTSSPLAKMRNGKPRVCTLKDQLVQSSDGSSLDSFEFFRSKGWLAPPHLPRRLKQKCSLALRRHCVTGPHEREALNLYVSHAKAVFKVDYASFMVASTNDSDMLILSQEGGKAEVQRVDRAVTLCAHAMLLSDDEVLVVPDTRRDWRFSACPSTNDGTPCSKLGQSLRFYASAPLYLSYSLDGIEGVVQAGRLCIMAREPRDFTEADAEILLTIARMASEALEKEYQIRRNAKTAEMQRRSANLVRAIETVEPSSEASSSSSARDAARSEQDDEEDGTAQSEPASGASGAQSNGSGKGIFRFSTSVIELACQELKGALGAVAVAAIDISGLRIKPASAPGTASPRSSAYPMTPWQVPDTSLLAAPMTPPSELAGAVADIGLDPPTPSSSPTTNRHPLQRTKSAPVDEVQPMSNGPPLQVLCMSGDRSYRPIVKGPRQTQALCDCLGRILRTDKLESRVRVYRTSTEMHPLSDEDGDAYELPMPSTGNPLAPLLPADALIREYAVIAGYNAQQGRPLFCFVVMFTEEASIEEPEQLFMESCVEYAIGSIIRQKARDIDGIQAEFLRHVQHNLRTPLHGAMGAVEYLRSFISGEAEGFTPSIDLRPDGVLATLLDSIALSGTTLNTYIDDLLSFQNLSGLTSSESRKKAKPTSTDLVKLIETVCNEEWDLAQRLEMQSQRLDATPTCSNGSLEMIVKADDNVTAHDWMVDATSLSQIVRKVVSNAVKFSRDGYIEVTVRAACHGPDASGPVPVEIEVHDTGVGMTREFCTDQLTKPFTKGDSFRDGIGLGMTIVSSLVQNMNGKLSVASELNVGTRVSMTIPLSIGDKPRRDSYASANSSEDQQVDASPHRPPFAIQRIAFLAMETRGLRRLSNSICEYLLPRGELQLVTDPLEADCIVLPDRAIPMLSSVELPFRDRLRAEVRLVVVQTVAMGVVPECVEAVQNRAVLPFLSPHGPSALVLLERFLREENPGLIRELHRPPALIHYHHDRSGSASQDGADGPRRRNSGQRHPSAASNVSDASSTATVVGAETLGKAGTSSDVEDGPATASQTAPQAADGEVAAEPAPTAEQPASQPQQPQQPQRKDSDDEFRVLVVEDNPINMKLIVTLLKRLHISYDEARDGAEAVSKFISFKPAVVLLDISLPIQDGFEACTQMRAHDHPAHIVAITALSSEEDRQRGIERCGMDAWMTKPVSPRVLKQDIVAWQKGWLEKVAEGAQKVADTAREVAGDVEAEVKPASGEAAA